MTTDTLTASWTTPILEHCAELVDARYVLPEVAPRVAEALRAAAAAGRYAACTGPEDLAFAVTAHLHELTADLHLRLLFHADGAVGEQDPGALEAYWREEARRTAGGVQRVERTASGVGVVVLGPVLCHPAIGGDAVAAAMSLVADADALVLDVRGCRGGSPDGVVLLLSHLFGPEPVRLGDVESREGGTHQYWTQSALAGRRFGPDKPVAVLTSAETFSGGEAVAFDLQDLGRATVVGERTRGGAHPRIGVSVHPQLELSLPVARSVSPRTGGNWEGAGVLPDVEVAASDALDTALAFLAHTA